MREMASIIRRTLSCMAMMGASFQVALAAQEMTEYRLDNGLHIVVIEDHRTPAVTQTLWYRVGGSDGPPGKSGLAHYVEHLMFKGTEKFGPGVFNRTVQDLGGTDNAFTSFDYTAYIQRISADNIERIMELEADRMQGLLLTEEDIEIERLVVLEERHTRTDSNPGALLQEQMNAALFLNHPYSIPIIGWRHEIEMLNREDIFEFYQAHYAPNNAILIIAGDVEPNEVLQYAKTHYGPLAFNPDIAERQRPQEPPQVAARRLTFQDERVSNPYIVRDYLAPERNSKAQREAASLELLAAILGGDGINSYLTQKLEVDVDIAIYSNAYYSGRYVDKNSFSLVVVPADSVSMEEAEEALDRALDEFLQEGVVESQLERIKKSIHASWIYEQDSVQNVARRIGHELSIGLTLKDIQAWPDILQSITSEEIMDAARRLFQLESSVTGWAIGKTKS